MGACRNVVLILITTARASLLMSTDTSEMTACDFETDLCGWRHVNTSSAMYWRRHRAPAPRFSNGPSFDHTRRSDRGLSPRSYRPTNYGCVNYLSTAAELVLVIWQRLPPDIDTVAIVSHRLLYGSASMRLRPSDLVCIPLLLISPYSLCPANIRRPQPFYREKVAERWAEAFSVCDKVAFSDTFFILHTPSFPRNV